MWGKGVHIAIDEGDCKTREAGSWKGELTTKEPSPLASGEGGFRNTLPRKELAKCPAQPEE